MSALLVKLARLLALWALPRKVRDNLGDVFAPIDLKVPHLLANDARPATIERTVALAVADVAKTQIKPSYVDAVLLLYSAVEAAKK